MVVADRVRVPGGGGEAARLIQLRAAAAGGLTGYRSVSVEIRVRETVLGLSVLGFGRGVLPDTSERRLGDTSKI